MLLLLIDLKFGFQFLINNKEGISVTESIQAQEIPKAIETPYPDICFIGEINIVKKAIDVVKEVRKIGSDNESSVVFIASVIFLFLLISLKKRDSIWTPSELAIVNNTIGIEVFIIVKLKYL